VIQVGNTGLAGNSLRRNLDKRQKGVIKMKSRPLQEQEYENNVKHLAKIMTNRMKCQGRLNHIIEQIQELETAKGQMDSIINSLDAEAAIFRNRLGMGVNEFPTVFDLLIYLTQDDPLRFWG
jgi:N-acetyl-gamma-glutamylphosphate reductase